MATWIKLVAAPIAVLLLFGVVAACAPVQLINALTPSASYVKAADIHYGPDARHQLDIYTPADLQGSAPVVVFIYGGSWNSGQRADYRFVAEALASRGIVAVLADYRLYPQVRYPAFLQDSALAVAWTLRQLHRYGGDPGRLFVMGHSAGARPARRPCAAG